MRQVPEQEVEMHRKRQRGNLQRKPSAVWSLPVLVAGLIAAAVGCGDDGTDGLSSCPGYRIARDKNDVWGCAPVTASAGSGAKKSDSVGASANARSSAGSGAPTAGSSAPR
jgi:hypothetical protein